MKFIERVLYGEMELKHLRKRTSRKQVEEILKAISTNEFKYKLIPIEFCGKWKYSISTYTREPKLTDMWGKVYTYTEWKHKERVLEVTTLKKAYEFSCELLHKVNFENLILKQRKK